MGPNFIHPAGRDKGFVVVAFRSRECACVVVSVALPFLAVTQKVPELVVGGGGVGGPVGEAEVFHRVVGAVGREDRPGRRAAGVRGSDRVVGGFGVGFGHPVAADLVAVAGLLDLEFAE